jgi:hypothetical protein
LQYRVGTSDASTKSVSNVNEEMKNNFFEHVSDDSTNQFRM